MKTVDTYKYVLGILFKARIARLICFILLFVGTAALNFVPFDKSGEKEYMLGVIICAAVPYMICVAAGLIFAIELSSNRLIRSCPAAKTIFTRTICGAVGIIYVIGTALTFAVRAAAALAGAGEMCALSDLLIVFCFITILNALLPLSIMFRNGFLTLCYFPMILILPLMFVVLERKNLDRSGFGLPLWSAAIIFAGTCAFSYAFSRAAVTIRYKKMNFNPNPFLNQSTGTQKQV